MEYGKSLTELLLGIKPGETIVLLFKSRLSLAKAMTRVAAFNSISDPQEKLYCELLTPRRSPVQLLAIICPKDSGRYGQSGTIFFH